MKCTGMIALLAMLLLPAGANAGIYSGKSERSAAKAQSVPKGMQVADYRRGNKTCYTRGSATICN